MENNENKVLCAQCNGRCCRQYACGFSPEQLVGYPNITAETIADMLMRDDVCLELTQGMQELYFIRCRHKQEYFLINYQRGGECVNFMDHQGCKLSFEERPYQGQVQVPNITGCYGISKYHLAALWEPYQRVIVEAIHLYAAKGGTKHILILPKLEP